MTAYYNEIDPKAAAWLRELIKIGAIAHGEVDTRSIEDVTPNDVRGYTQCHWFAGIGGWSLALRLAGWPDSKRAWTGSCPCQPFSSAGKGAGVNDERHLWPAWMHLIRQCRPGAIFGEQVAAAIRHGWLDTVLDDLENTGYACWAADLPAGGIGAPQLRERVWFGGKLAGGIGNGLGERNRGESAESGRTRPRAETVRRGDACELGIIATEAARYRQAIDASGWDDCVWIPCTDGKWRPTQPGIFPLAHGIPKIMGRMRAQFLAMGLSPKDAMRHARTAARIFRGASKFRTSQIKGYGNAIVPQVAAEFIKAAML